MFSLDILKPLHGSHGEMKLNVKLTVKEGEFVVLMGESGAGKTTLLRILAGLEQARGSIVAGDDVWLSDTKILRPQEREIGFVFQDYALFEHMSAEENLLFVNHDKVLTGKLLALTELEALASRNVKGLSGGQKQRVSLCRAMMRRPKLLLMDEPLSALDSKMKLKLQEEIALFHKMFGITTIMISHDANSAHTLAQRIIVMEQGRIIKDGRPDEVLSESMQVVYRL